MWHFIMGFYFGWVLNDGGYWKAAIIGVMVLGIEIAEYRLNRMKK